MDDGREQVGVFWQMPGDDGDLALIAQTRPLAKA